MADIEYELMGCCLREKGKWWANHFFCNKEVNSLYFKRRVLSLGEVLEIINTAKL